jgi:serine/threonine protein kinase
MEKVRIIKRIGGGSFGDVFLGSLDGSDVAVKRIFERAPERGVERPDPARELHVLAELDHPNVARLIGHYRGKDGAQMLVFPFYRGGTLADLLSRAARPLDEATARGFLHQLFTGLDYLHASVGVVHRDIKSSNLLLDTGGALHIADFGQAKPTASASRMTPHTGTRWARSPEMLFGSTSYDPAVDVWAAGCLAAELLTGSPPFQGESDIAQIARVAEKLGFPTPEQWPELEGLPDSSKLVFAPRGAPSPATWLPGLTAAAQSFVLSLLQWRPTDRLTAAEALEHPWLKAGPLLRPPHLPSSDVATQGIRVSASSIQTAGVAVLGGWEGSEAMAIQHASALIQAIRDHPSELPPREDLGLTTIGADGSASSESSSAETILLASHKDAHAPYGVDTFDPTLFTAPLDTLCEDLLG